MSAIAKPKRKKESIMITYRDEKEDFRNAVWGALMIDAPDVYLQARRQETEINALIDQGNEAEWDAESIAQIIIREA